MTYLSVLMSDGECCSRLKKRPLTCTRNVFIYFYFMYLLFILFFILVSLSSFTAIKLSCLLNVNVINPDHQCLKTSFPELKHACMYSHERSLDSNEISKHYCSLHSLPFVTDNEITKQISQPTSRCIDLFFTED